ncbi:site-2 protease family protein [Calycomorphotria hydatis]|uniref:HlyD family secretion protein n=1 Tax=Calycomorphotria hydatis TaxID=2528027 RepID=A0A517T549_9PLAN|nr:site-2 protease family protein [Calycomorphotria hydatis]QDT63503.1 HlyD family secretion protein [Calycomorphotria hydatis]
MSELNSINSSRVPYRARPDLEAHRQRYRGETVWCLKDPLSRRYYHLPEYEFQLLQWLDGRRTIGELIAMFRERFPSVTLAPQRLSQFLAEMRQEGLLLAQTPKQGRLLLKSAQRRETTAWRNSLLGILAIRFPGIDPQAILVELNHWVGWIFSRAGVLLGLMLVAFAGLALLGRWEEMYASLPTMNAFLTVDNLVLLLLVFAGVKVLHELGHGLAAIRCGGDCREIGLLLLVFTPCLYCDVTDAWRLRSKWQRIGIGLAGIWVELLLAAVATLLWCMSEPGLVRTLCLNVMLISSINTLLFNGNPLLRYDGYFVLADYLEIPNLADESRKWWRARWRNWFFPEGDTATAFSHDIRREFLLAVYGFASTLYRLFVLALILWLVWSVLSPLGLAPFAVLMTGMMLFGLVAMPVMSTAKVLKSAEERKRLSPTRTIVFLLFMVGLIAFVCLIPLPSTVEAPVLVEVKDAAKVFVSVPGRLVSAAQEGTTVKAGTGIAELENINLEGRLLEAESKVAELELRASTLDARRIREPEAAALMAFTQESLIAARNEVEELERELQRLTLTAPQAGVILPPPKRPPSNDDTEEQLASWEGTPLDPQNLGVFLEAGTLVCEVGDPEHLQLIAYVDEDGVERVREGQTVRTMIDGTNTAVTQAKVISVGTEPLHELPVALAVSGLVPVQQSDPARWKPLSPLFEVKLELPADAWKKTPLPRIRSTGRCKIEVASQTLLQRLSRSLRRLFQFELV